MHEEDLATVTIRCPHCGHTTVIDLDTSAGDQDYQEECEACGDIIHVQLSVDERHNKTSVRIDANDEQFY